MEPTLLNRRYRLLSLIGTGGMATVYRAHDLLLDRHVAVKFLREPYASDPAFRRRFLEEARAAARLEHPNIVGIHDVGEDEQGRPYIVMELVEGEDLKTLIRRAAPLPVAQALELTRQICAGVGAAHRAGLIHCDLKPQNILVTPDGQVKVADFGIARAFQRGREVADETVRETVVWGSPHYISPEQAAGRPPTPASDVYSIGVMMYEMLTGVPPFHDADPTALLAKHLREEPPPLSAFNPRVPPTLEWLIRKVLAKEPAQRYRNADQLGIVIDEYRRQGTLQTAPQAAAPASVVAAPTANPPVVTPSAPGVAPQPQPSTVAPTRPVPQETSEEGPDWLLWALLLVATMAVLGLLPLWGYVYRLYTAGATPPPLASPETTPTPTSALPMVTVPNVVGLSLNDAQRLAESVGLRVEVIGQQESAEARPGAVLEQVPAAGVQVPQETVINLVIAKGRILTMPDVIGYRLDAVEDGLASEGLLVEVEEVWSTRPKGEVLESEPRPGAQVRAGDTVTLTVSGGTDVPIPLGVDLNGQVVLEQAIASPLELRPGEIFSLILRWRCVRPLDHSYKVFIHILTEDFQPLTQRDIEPVNGLRPTNTWLPGEIINDPHQLEIPADAPPGTYQVRVGLYDAAGRLPVADAGRAEVRDDTILVTTIRVQP